MSDRLYLQVDIAFGRNRRVKQIGAMGWIVFQHLVACHRINPADGWVSASDAEPESIVLGLPVFGAAGSGELDEDVARDAMGRLQRSGMVELDELGNVLIVGWEDWHGPKSSTERSKRHRKRLRADVASSEPDDGSTDAGRNATERDGCNATGRPGRDGTVQRDPSSLLSSSVHRGGGFGVGCADAGSSGESVASGVRTPRRKPRPTRPEPAADHIDAAIKPRGGAA